MVSVLRNVDDSLSGDNWDPMAPRNAIFWVLQLLLAFKIWVLFLLLGYQGLLFGVLCVLSYVFDGLVVSRNFQDHPKMEGRMVADVGSDPLQQDITAIAIRLARCRHVGMMEMVAR